MDPGSTRNPGFLVGIPTSMDGRIQNEAEIGKTNKMPKLAPIFE